MQEGTDLRNEEARNDLTGVDDMGNVSVEDGKKDDVPDTKSSQENSSESETINQLSGNVLGNDRDQVMNVLSQVREDIAEQSSMTTKISHEIREMHKLYHNEFASRLRNMQEELERYHEIDRGRVYDDILREIARIYCDNEGLLSVDADDKLKKRIKYLFMDIEQLLEANGVKIQRSSPGDKRNNKFCQIVDRVETADPAKHDTVVCSKGTGFYTEKRSLIKELIDIYICQIADEDSKSGMERS